MVSTLESPTRNARNNGTSTRGKSMAKSSSASTPADLDKNRTKALEVAVGQIERAFGKGSIMRLDDDPSNIPPGIATGSISRKNSSHTQPAPSA